MSNIEIHHSSIIEPGAKIGEGTKIGPFCCIENDVIIGENCQLDSHVVIKSGTIIQENAKIHSHAVLGDSPQNNKHGGGYTNLLIGKNCNIREGVTMHKGSDNSLKSTIVGDNCLFLAYSHVAHDCVIGNHVTFSNNVMIGGHVTIGDFVTVGGGAAIHQFTRVGHHAFVGGMAALVGDLIPFGMAIGVHAHLEGLNLTGMKRHGIERDLINHLRHAIKIIFENSKTEKERLKEAKEKFSDIDLVMDVISFIESPRKRPICMPRKKSNLFSKGDNFI